VREKKQFIFYVPTKSNELDKILFVLNQLFGSLEKLTFL
jgi:hypothetical protein